MFQDLINIYNIEWQGFSAQQKHINALQTWIMATVDKQYLSVCCKSTGTLRDWYSKLTARVKPNLTQRYNAVWDKYASSTRVLTRPPKDPYTWLKRWTMAVKKAMELNIVLADNPITWLKGFINTIKQWKPNWARIYGAQYTRDIKDGTLTFYKVAAHFEEKLIREAKVTRGPVAKEVFGPMFDEKGSDKGGTKENESSA